MKSIFPAAIDGDLLKLVHLSSSFRSSFRMVEGAKPLQVGDICHSEARIVSVTNSSEGYSLNTPGVTATFNAPLTNESYSKISGDFNPFHVYPYFSDFGSQEPGMGMDLYNSSPAARAVWEGAHLAVYGFSIVEIVKDNPKEKQSTLAVSKVRPFV
jgi:Acyl transferase domain